VEVYTGNMKNLPWIILIALSLVGSAYGQIQSAKTPETRREELTAERELLKHIDKEYGVVCYEGFNCVKI